jgi:hypothetical protein
MEILQNTILKLVFRQGSNTDRKKVVFTSGEPVFTNDTNRLFVGTGALSGGKLVGNVFKGVSPDLASLAPGEIGDFAYNNDKQELAVINTNDGSAQSDWLTVAKPNSLLFARYNGSLSAMEASKGVSVQHLSAGHYRFTYSAFPSLSSYTPLSQVMGNLDSNYTTSIDSITLSSCDVIYYYVASKQDGRVSFVLNY